MAPLCLLPVPLPGRVEPLFAPLALLGTVATPETVVVQPVKVTVANTAVAIQRNCITSLSLRYVALTLPFWVYSIDNPKSMAANLAINDHRSSYLVGRREGSAMVTEQPEVTISLGEPARITPNVLVGVSLWRLLIIVFALVGFCSAVNQSGTGALPALSQQANVFTAAVYLFLLLFPLFTGGVRHEPDTPWLRGTTTVLLGLVSVTFLTLIGGSLASPWSLFEHLLTPLVVLIDWVVVGKAQRNVRWWFPISWVILPLAYLVFYIFYVRNHELIYDFLDPSRPNFPMVVFEFLCGVLVFGYLVYGIGKLKGALAAAP